MKEKTKLEREAIAAFDRQYEELPADAGWPVVKQWGRKVFFARSLEEWKAYKFGQILMSVLFKAVILIIFGAIGLAVFGYYKIALYCALAYLLAFASTLLLPRKNNIEIRMYRSNDGRICRIII